jgi:hypothetical protein
MSGGDIVTKRDVAELLQVIERTVKRWMAEGSIPYTPLPKRGAWSEARFLRLEIVEWMGRRLWSRSSQRPGTVLSQNAFGGNISFADFWRTPRPCRTIASCAGRVLRSAKADPLNSSF